MSLNRVTRLQRILSWLMVLTSLAILLFIVAPARGAYWFSDDGLFLRMSWEAANGYGWDRMLPQSPSYLFHALWMKIGLIQYLHFRYLHYVFSFLCALVFFGGLITKPSCSFVYPATVLLSILVSLNSIESPNSLVMNFFLLGAGCYFYALKIYWQFFKQLLFLCAGIALAICGFMHAAAAIACILIALLMISITSEARHSILLPSFLIVLIGLWTWYVNQVGLASLMQTPAAHEFDIFKLLHRLKLLLEFVFRPLVLYFICVWLTIHWLVKRHQLNSQLVSTMVCMSLSWGATCLACLSIMSYLLNWDWRFPGWRGILQIPGLIYYPFFFLIFLAIYNTVFNRPKKRLKVDEVKILSVEQQKQIIALLGFILLPAALAVGSNTAIIQGLVFFAGPAAGLVIYLWCQWVSIPQARLNGMCLEYQSKSSVFAWHSWKLLFLAWVIVFATFSLGYNHPSPRNTLAGGLSAINVGPLRGIRESTQYRDSLDQIGDIYRAQHCAKKTLVVLDYAPMLYYIFGHAASNQLGVMRPMYYYPVEKIKNALGDPNGWCAIDLTGLETQDDIQKQGVDRRESLRLWLQEHGSRYDAIAPGPELIGNIAVYVK